MTKINIIILKIVIKQNGDIVGYAGYNFTKIGQDYSENNKIITKYFYLRSYPACYYCVINNNAKKSELPQNDKYKKAYYTAIARERQLTYKMSKQITDMLKN